jgi:hypothetical protein
MSDVDRLPPRLLRRAEALADGVTDGELARLVRLGDLARLRRGTYLRDAAGLDAVDRHRLRAMATARGLRVPGVVSSASAAVLHGLPVWNVPLRRVHILRRPPANGSGTQLVHLHVARFSDSEVSLVAGVPTTDVTRTVVDLARSVPFESAVVTADAALASRATTPELLADCLARMGPTPGTRRAARVLAFADGRSESVGESRSRVLLKRLGLPAPDLQVLVRRRDHTLIGRCDFGWREQRTLAEFDGRVKYGRLLRPGQTPGDVVFTEKLREDALRDEGWQVVRWTWADLARPSLVADRLGRAFARG